MAVLGKVMFRFNLQMYGVFHIFHRITQTTVDETQQKSLSSIFCLALVLYEAFSIANACELVREEVCMVYLFYSFVLFS